MELVDYKQLEDPSSLPTPLQNTARDSFYAFSFDNTTPSGSTLGSENSAVLVVHKTPLKFELYRDGVLQISANDRSLLHFESSSGESRKLAASEKDTVESDEDRHGGKEITGYWEDGLAIYADGTREEQRELRVVEDSDPSVIKGDAFGGHPDSQKLGPMSVGIDFAFPYASDVYGIPEHTSPLSLPTTMPGSAGLPTKYEEPYRMYTLDVFEYELDNTMALYGGIPLMLAHANTPGQTTGMTAAVFWFNPSETFIDISDGGSNAKPFKESHWISESGEVDFFLFSGPTVRDIYRQYTSLTGTQQLPPMFSLGYHQCRWNYRDEKDVAAVEAKFEELDYPYDVLWLDIEHTDGKRYFTWDKSVFPNPIDMQANLTKHGRKMVTIVDPHIKRDNNYHIHKEATEKGLYILNKDGDNFDGWCWPGQSSYLDFTDAKVRHWWAQQFALNKYIGSTMDLFTWNDMNEPSVFNGPEVSMPKDAKNLAGVEHREWHNLYGLYMQMATQLGLTIRSPTNAVAERPFVLTRSFWAGSQRWGAMWTGDNSATWGHLKIASPMLLSINLGGLSFAGADVGGFFGEPGAELFTRWYQAGAFTPFFRGHAHHDTKRREPWVFGEPYTTVLRDTAMLRYTLLPLWYTTFFEAYETGMPVMRPLFMEFSDDSTTFKMDDQWMVGSALLVKPVTDKATTEVNVYLPGSDNWYDLHTLAAVPANTPGTFTRYPAPLGVIPVFVRPGTVLPRKMRLRRSSKLMFYDPYTLVVAPDSTGKAEGALYLDDEHSLAHEASNQFALRSFTFSSTGSPHMAVLTCAAASRPGGSVPSSASFADTVVNTVERIVIAGQRTRPFAVRLSAEVGSEDSIPLSYVFDEEQGVLTIKKPNSRVVEDWVVTIDYAQPLI